MKKTDIIVVVICALVIILAAYFVSKGLMPKSQPTTTQNKATIEFTGQIDTDTINKLQKRKDYGSPPMDNIGRDNPFANF